MRQANKGLIAAAAAALIATGGVALAQGGPHPAMGPGHGPADRHEMGGHHDRRGHDEHALRFLDTNHDHKVSLDEIKAQEDRIIALADVNGDGTLSPDEFRRRGMMFMRLRAFSFFDLLDANGDGKLSLAEVQGPSERWFARYDKNHDGELEADELAPEFGEHPPGPAGARGDHGPRAMHAERFIRFLDTNHDGKVSLAEIKGEEERIFKYADTNNDGSLSPEEFRHAGILLMRLRAATLFDLLDANGDGKLTKAEIQAPSERWFARYDANKDGFLDPYELRQSMGPRGRR